MQDAASESCKKHRQAIQHHIDGILKHKEALDIAHVKKSAAYGCHCKRCKAARLSLTPRKL